MKQATSAKACINRKGDWVKFKIAFVLLKKALFLYYFIKEKGTIALHADFTELMARATSIITSKRMDVHVAKWIRMTPEELAYGLIRDGSECTWVELALMTVPTFGQTDVQEHLQSALDMHMLVAGRMATHLQLSAQNIDRTPWLAARLLSREPAKVQEGANALLEYLKRLRPEQCTPYEAWFLAQDQIMCQLGLLADAVVPSLLWQQGGRYSDLFRHLASRFLSAPDSVLDCEGVHARWKWIEVLRRGIKLKLLNAILKLQEYLHFFGSFPSHADLLPYLRDQRLAYHAEYKEIVRAGVVAKGMRSDVIFQSRFNLNPAEAELVAEAEEKPPELKQTITTAWGSYVRFLFEPGHVYSFDALAPNQYFYVVENKSFAYRDMPCEDAAQGRTLSIAWFSEVGNTDLHGAMILEPCEGLVGDLILQAMTVADISRAAGYYPPHADDATARELEVLHEQALLQHNLIVYKCRPTDVVGDATWALVLHEGGRDVEDHVFEARALADLSKMALARQLQLRDGLNNSERDARWRLLKKAQLIAALLGPGPAAGAAPAAAPAIHGAPAAIAAPAPAGA